MTDQFAQNNIASSDPELAEALSLGDDNKIEKIIGKRIHEQMETKRKEQEKRVRLLKADPNDMEAQKEIEEMIKKDMVNDNYTTAQDQFPEFFGQITMLYTNVQVNKTPIQAFVDSGAQSTIIS